MVHRDARVTARSPLHVVSAVDFLPSGDGSSCKVSNVVQNAAASEGELKSQANRVVRPRLWTEAPPSILILTVEAAKSMCGADRQPGCTHYVRGPVRVLSHAADTDGSRCGVSWNGHSPVVVRGSSAEVISQRVVI